MNTVKEVIDFVSDELEAIKAVCHAESQWAKQDIGRAIEKLQETLTQRRHHANISN